MTKPGGIPVGAPSTFEFLTDQRLSSNGNLTRMPTNQQEWGTFIRELDKWIKNETGAFTPTFGGFSSAPGAGYNGDGPLVWWHRYGQLVHMEFLFGLGTSNDTFFSITNLPANITPKYDSTVMISGMSDNSVSLTDPQTVEIGSDGNIFFYTSAFTGAWTGSNNKGFGTGNPSKSIIYSLRNPSKL
jgi:hypothetical protein